jgi:hypothetical protein
VFERGNDLGVVADQCVDMRGRLIAAAQPDDLRRRPKQRGHVGKVRVLRDQREAIVCHAPDRGFPPDRAAEPDSIREKDQPVVDRV